MKKKEKKQYEHNAEENIPPFQLNLKQYTYIMSNGTFSNANNYNASNLEFKIIILSYTSLFDNSLITKILRYSEDSKSLIFTSI